MLAIGESRRGIRMRSLCETCIRRSVKVHRAVNVLLYGVF